MFPVPELCGDRCWSCFQRTGGGRGGSREFHPGSYCDDKSRIPGGGEGGEEEEEGSCRNHYQVLGIGRYCSHDEVVRAAKEMRVRMHPDRRKRLGMTEVEMKVVDEEAARVGMAADVLTDPELRERYDVKVFG